MVIYSYNTFANIVIAQLTPLTTQRDRQTDWYSHFRDEGNKFRQIHGWAKVK